MTYYAGIEVSLEYSSVCVVDGAGKIMREQKIASEPEALIAWFRGLGFDLERIGLEAGPMSQWLYAAMRAAGPAIELLETRHVRDAFKAMPVKSDRNDARGIAQLMRLGWFRPVTLRRGSFLRSYEGNRRRQARPMARNLRHLYTHRKWRRLRRYQLAKEPLCRYCLREGRVTPALVADHIAPHRGNINEFWIGELQSLCKDCHDRLKAQQERRGWIDGVGLDGMPLDPNHPVYQR